MRIITETPNEPSRWANHYVTDDLDTFRHSQDEREFIAISRPADEYEVKYLHKSTDETYISFYAPYYTSTSSFLCDIWIRTSDLANVLSRAGEWYAAERIAYQTAFELQRERDHQQQHEYFSNEPPF